MSAPEPIRLIEGTKDLFGPAMARYRRVQQTAASIFERYGYRKIATPVFEDTRLFARSIGEATDIVEKEMYTFAPGSDSLTLRPEGTAGVVRAFLQHALYKENGFLKLWYEGPMFRRERPQKGRQRQFHQVGVEALGSADPLLDAEVIRAALDLYDALGVTGVRTRINSIGCPRPECRPAYREALRRAAEPLLPQFCKNCQARHGRNVLRLLDCKVESCRALAANLPRIADALCPGCRSHQEAVEEALAAAGVAFTVDPAIVRGLDYYTRTVFELSHPALGAQDAIGGGGRYDGLVESLGGPPTPAVGFALGVERILIAMEALDACACEAPLLVFGVAADAEERKALSGLLARVRQDGFSADMDFEGKSFKAQMRRANRLGALVTLILGSDELASGTVTVKDMREGGGQERVPLESFLGRLRELLPPV